MSDGARRGNRLGPARAIEAVITADEATSAWPNRSWPEKTMTAAAAAVVSVLVALPVPEVSPGRRREA